MTNEKAMAMQALAIKNIRYLLEKQGKGIGDLERHIGVCKGYFSRSGNGAKTNIPFTAMLKSADYVNTNLQELIETDMEQKYELVDIDIRIAELERRRAELLRGGEQGQ